MTRLERKGFEMIVYGLPVGQGILALSPIPGSDGDYAGDVQHLIEWKPAIVVSLVTEIELAAAGAAGLWHDLVDAGTRWEHMPISDFGVPDDEFEQAWPEVSANARRALTGGGRVLVHCRGGCGRSGMVALRLMIEMGEAADDARDRLRHVRPCAIETSEQMGWALQAKREPALFLRHAD
ncbi:protein-tyrosine phosphatase family protein [Marivita sp.]|uniref:protein-tyrosine phosphatase family protein n=1 Tax=Marivita sp. TaxID=2003365 RepID=UPI003F706339